MKRISPLVFSVCVMAVAGRALAAGTAATASAVDMSSPRATLQSVYGAMRAGNIATVTSCLIFEDAEAEEVFDCSATQVCVPLRLMHVMEEKFGAAGEKPFDMSVERSIDEALARVKTAEISVTGDTAVVAKGKAELNPNAETELSGVTLKQVGGKWKVVASTFPDSGGDVSPRQMALMRSLRDAIVRACEATIARLNHGDFHSAEEAYASYQALLQPTARAAGSPAAGGGH